MACQRFQQVNVEIARRFAALETRVEGVACSLARISYEPFEHLGNCGDLPRLPERFFEANTASQNDTLFAVILSEAKDLSAADARNLQSCTYVVRNPG